MLNKKAVINNSLFYLQNYYKYRISEITQTQVFHLFILRQLTLWCIQDFQIDRHTAGFLLPMIFSGYIFSIVIFSYYFLLHNVRIKRYFSPNLIPTNYSTLCSSRNFIICLYIQHKSHSTDYSSKEWLSLFLSDTYGKYTRIFIFTQKNQLTVSWFLIVPSKLHTCWHSLKIILPAILGQALTRLVTVSSMCCHTSTSALSTSSSSRGFTS